MSVKLGTEWSGGGLGDQGGEIIEERWGRTSELYGYCPMDGEGRGHEKQSVIESLCCGCENLFVEICAGSSNVYQLPMKPEFRVYQEHRWIAPFKSVTSGSLWSNAGK